jgi:SNF2 family DNA or RNA helicase
MSKVYAEIFELPRSKRIGVSFPYDKADIATIKAVPGRKWNHDHKVWMVPLSLETGRLLRGLFGSRLVLGPALKAWGQQAIRAERNLGRLATADDAELHNVPAKMADWLDAAQRANVAYLAERNAIEGSQPGIGKTEILIATVLEAEVSGPVLVSAPVTTLQMTWELRIKRWIPDAIVLTGETLKQRETAVAEAARLAAEGRQFWLCVNPEMIRLKRDRTAEPAMSNGKLQHPLVAPYPELHAISWGAVIIDEFRKVGLSNRRTQAHQGFSQLHTERRWALSGTPMGGNPMNLWGTLNWIDPHEYTSQWQWMERWMESEDNHWAASGKTFLPKIKAGMEDEFYASLARHMVRRTRAETRTNAPPRVHDVWCKMRPSQARQYRDFDKTMDSKLDSGARITAENHLSAYLRLKQIACCEIEDIDGKVTYRNDMSGKIDQLMQQLEIRGITGGADEDGDEKVVIAAPENQLLAAVEARLSQAGIEYLTITGKQKPSERNAAQAAFQQDGGPRVMLINTFAGGLGIDLDRADSVHILQVTWDPDDQEQVEFRIDRRGRTRQAQMDIYYYWTVNTVDEIIKDLLETKTEINVDTLDQRRKAYKENQ